MLSHKTSLLATGLVVSLAYLSHYSYGILSPRNPFDINPASLCLKLPFYIRRHTRLCSKDSNKILRIVMLNGTLLATKECQRQFQMRRWNCTTDRMSVERIISNGFRETAFLYAIQSAGVAYSISIACRMGILSQCRCVKKKKRRLRKTASKENKHIFEWSDKCLDDALSYGIQISRYLLENVQVRDVRGMVDEHNKEAGRRAITTYERTECRCHGISGACAVKQCWRRLPYFATIGEILQMKYDAAVKVMADNKGKKLLPYKRSHKPYTKWDLVYTADSPKFCEPDPKLGSLGTKGRRCSPGENRLDNCGILCCNRSYSTSVVMTNEPCHCTFKYCCYVNCKTCSHNRTVYTCK